MLFRTVVWFCAFITIGCLSACQQTKPGGEETPSGSSAAGQASANGPHERAPMEGFDAAAVEQVFGKSLSEKQEFYKIAFPRTDLSPAIDGIPLEPGFSHTSWMAFLPLKGGQSMMMGDMVLRDEEISAVLPLLAANDIQVTAIHNHLANETPRLKYMHIAAIGPPERIATGMKKVYQATGLPLGFSQKPAPDRIETPDWGRVEDILGKQGKHTGSLLKFAFPRAHPVRMKGVSLPASFGVATAVNFQHTGNNQAVITGDFVMRAEEVTAIQRALTAHGITATALHNHMLHEEPRLFYMHFWGKGEPDKLAKGLKAALAEGDYR